MNVRKHFFSIVAIRCSIIPTAFVDLLTLFFICLGAISWHLWPFCCNITCSWAVVRGE